MKRGENMKKSRIAKLVSILFIIMLIVGGICLFFLNDLYDLFKEPSVPLFNQHSIYYRIAFYSCYIISLIIIYFLMKLFNQVYRESPFASKIVSYLNLSAILFMILSIIVLIKIYFIPTLLSLVVALVCFMVSLSFYVLKEVMKAAILYKKEIDYTV